MPVLLHPRSKAETAHLIEDEPAAPAGTSTSKPCDKRRGCTAAYTPQDTDCPGCGVAFGYGGRVEA